MVSTKKIHPYFKRVIELAGMVRGVQTILDVGGGDGRMIQLIQPEKELLRVVVDPIERIFLPEKDKEIIFFNKNFLDTDLGKFDLVVCCQVMEHIARCEQQTFAKKLYDSTQRRLILSIPYRWQSQKDKFQLVLDEWDVMDWFRTGFYKEIIAGETLICVWDVKF